MSALRSSHWKWMWISLTFTTIVLIVVLYFTIDERTFEYIRRLNPLFLLAAFALHSVALGMWALRIQKMADYLGYTVPFHHCYRLILANLFVAAITPSQAGGEPIRIHQLYRAGVPVGDATALVILERVLDAIILGLTGGVVIVLLGHMLVSPASPAMIALYIAWGMLLAFIALFLYSVRSPAFLKRILKRVFGWIVKRWEIRKVETILGRIDREIDNFQASLTYFIRSGKRGFFGLPVLLTLLFWGAEFFTASLILMGLDLPPHIIESFVAQIIIAIVMMVPLTPGGSGIAEVSATSLYSLFIPASIVGVFVVLWRIIFYYFNLVAGFLAGITIIRREAITVTLE